MSIYPKNFKVIGCESLTRPINHFSLQSPHRIEIVMNQIGLHDNPEKLHERIQKEIDLTESSKYDAILLVYGLCGSSLDGIKSSNTPLVLPRAHDCITLLLGSRQKYMDEQTTNPGTYWLSQDFLERSSGDNGASLGAGFNEDTRSIYDKYKRKYGRENAEYLLQTMQSWQYQYNRVVLLEDELNISPNILDKAEMEASKKGLKLETMTGNLILIKKLFYGDWDGDFLIVPPNSQIKMSLGEEIITSTNL